MIHFSHILFEPVVLRENFLSRLDARIKIAFCIFALILNLVLPGNIFQVLLLIFYFAVALSWKVRLRYIFSRLFIPFLIGILLLFTKLGSLHLFLSILAGVSTVSLLSFSAPFEDILSASSKLKWCPTILIEITFLMYKYIFIFFEEIDAIYHAQAARLGYINMKNAVHSLGILVGMLIIRSFIRAQSAYEAILARGYKDRLFY